MSPLIFIVGPSAVGKSQAALQLARSIDAHIISCDAMQVYREVSIASDKPRREILQQVPHYGIDLVSVTEDFDVAQFRRQALKDIAAIEALGKRVVIVGGSGMYVNVLLGGIFDQGPRDDALRRQLSDEAKDKGIVHLHERLKALDPQAAQRIHAHDTQRIIRALEMALTAPMNISHMQSQRRGLWGEVPIKIIGLNRPRAELYQRAQERIEAMFDSGLVSEVERLLELPLSPSAAKLIGVPEVSGYLKGEYDLNRAKYLMKLNTRHYIKRQLTWFRRDPRIEWININSGDSLDSVTERIKALV